jgi:hypothetical protein
MLLQSHTRRSQCKQREGPKLATPLELVRCHSACCQCLIEPFNLACHLSISLQHHLREVHTTTARQRCKRHVPHMPCPLRVRVALRRQACPYSQNRDFGGGSCTTNLVVRIVHEDGHAVSSHAVSISICRCCPMQRTRRRRRRRQPSQSAASIAAAGCGGAAGRPQSDSGVGSRTHTPRTPLRSCRNRGVWLYENRCWPPGRNLLGFTSTRKWAQICRNSP